MKSQTIPYIVLIVLSSCVFAHESFASPMENWQVLSDFPKLAKNYYYKFIIIISCLFLHCRLPNMSCSAVWQNKDGQNFKIDRIIESNFKYGKTAQSKILL